MAKEFNQGLKTALKLIAYLDDNEAQKMKKTAIAIAVALAGFATVAQAAPKDNTWYAGGKLGWSQYHDTGCYGNGYLNNDGPTHESSAGCRCVPGLPG